MSRTDPEIRALYERIAPILHRRALRLLGNDDEAWDAVHDVFVRLLSGGWSTFGRRSAPLTYAYRITTNVCLNMLRSRRVSDRAKAQIPGRPVVGVPAHDAAEFLQRLMEVVGRERGADRLLQVAVYKHIEEMTVEEIARVLGQGARTVKRDLARLRRLAQDDQTLKVFEVIHG